MVPNITPVSFSFEILPNTNLSLLLFFVYIISFFPLIFLHDFIYARVLKLSDTTILAFEMKPHLVSVVIWSETILGKLNYSFRKEMEPNQ